MDALLCIMIITASLLGIVIIMFPDPLPDERLKRRRVFDVLMFVAGTSSRRKKIAIIRTNLGPGLSKILRLIYDKTIILDVQPDQIQYIANYANTRTETMNRSSRAWHGFLVEATQIPKNKKALRMKGMLEGLDPIEAEVFVKAASGSLFDLGISGFTLRRCVPQVFEGRW